MADLLSSIWFASALAGVLAGLAAFFWRQRRYQWLMIAGGCFFVAGILGIFSIGIFFIILSTACFVLSGREHGAPSPPSGAATPLTQD